MIHLVATYDGRTEWDHLAIAGWQPHDVHRLAEARATTASEVPAVHAVYCTQFGGGLESTTALMELQTFKPERLLDAMDDVTGKSEVEVGRFFCPTLAAARWLAAYFLCRLVGVDASPTEPTESADLYLTYPLATRVLENQLTVGRLIVPRHETIT